MIFDVLFWISLIIAIISTIYLVIYIYMMFHSDEPMPFPWILLIITIISWIAFITLGF